MTPKKKSPNELSGSVLPKQKLQLAEGKQLVSFEIESKWRALIDAKVKAGHYDSFSAYMRHLVRGDLGLEDHRLKKAPGDTSAPVTAQQFLPYEPTKLTQEAKEGTTNHVRVKQNRLRDAGGRRARNRASKGDKSTAHNGR